MRPSRPPRETAGVVSLEFLIAFPSLWVFCLCVFQLVLLARADLLVRHAADVAARSAAVVLPDDPSRYQGEPEMTVSPDLGSGERRFSRVSSPEHSQKGPAKADQPGLPLGRLSLQRRSRSETIAMAAEVPLLSLRSALLTMRHPTVNSAIGPRRISDVLLSRPSGLTVRFPDAVEGHIPGPEVTVRVEYQYLCGVPIARRIVCNSGPRGTRIWEFVHAATLLVHDAPYAYRGVRES
jgi:hypothetical protein